MRRWHRSRRPTAGLLGVAVGIGALLIGAGLATGRDIVARTASRDSVVISGRLSGVPKSRRRVVVTVEAVSLQNGSIAAVAAPAGSGYSLNVPAGPYLVAVDVVDLPHTRNATAFKAVLASGRTKSVDLTVHAATAFARRHGDSEAHAAATGPVIGIPDIPITAPEGRLPGGADAGIITGMLPICAAHGGKIVDQTKQITDAIKTEQQLSDDGRLEFKFQYSPLTPDLVISGEITVGPNGGPRADLTVTDASTGEVVNHYVIGGDPDDWNNLGSFEHHLGEGLGNNLTGSTPSPRPCSEPSAPPPPPSAGSQFKLTGDVNATITSEWCFGAGSAAEGNAPQQDMQDGATPPSEEGSQSGPELVLFGVPGFGTYAIPDNSFGSIEVLYPVSAADPPEGPPASSYYSWGNPQNFESDDAQGTFTISPDGTGTKGSLSLTLQPESVKQKPGDNEATSAETLTGTWDCPSGTTADGTSDLLGGSGG